MGSIQAESGNKIGGCPTVEEVKIGAWRICRLIASEPHIFVRARTAHDAKQIAAPILRRRFEDDVSSQSLDAVFYNSRQLIEEKVLVIVIKGAEIRNGTVQAEEDLLCDIGEER
jgi:hypothetical protein